MGMWLGYRRRIGRTRFFIGVSRPIGNVLKMLASLIIFAGLLVYAFLSSFFEKPVTPVPGEEVSVSSMTIAPDALSDDVSSEPLTPEPAFIAVDEPITPLTPEPASIAVDEPITPNNVREEMAAVDVSEGQSASLFKEAQFLLSEDRAKEAFSTFKKLAKNGFPPAQYQLGLMYEQGHGTRKSKRLARKWYRKAEKSRHPLAAEKLREIQK